MSRLKSLFHLRQPYTIGMIHVKPLPGTPNHNIALNAMIDQVLKEAEIYKSCKIDSVLIENMHDIPYIQSHKMGPEITASMTRLCTEVRKLLPSHMSCGVQVLAGGNKEALAVAQAADLQFIRVEGYIYSHVADEGLMNACAGELLRYRKQIGAENVYIYTDIKKKHCSHSITDDVTLQETAKATQFFLSDGIILTGKTTGDAVEVSDLKKTKSCCSLPILIGSGVTADNLGNYIEADAFIIGSYFKKDGLWSNDVDQTRVLDFVKALQNQKRQNF